VNNLSLLLTQYKEKKLDYPSFRNKFTRLLEDHGDLGELKNSLQYSKHLFSEAEFDELITILSTNDDKTILGDSDSDDKTRLHPVDDKTRLMDDDKTRLKETSPLSDDETVISESIRSSKPARSSEDQTTVSPNPPPAPPSTKNLVLKPGAIVKERFVLEKLLGQGGMGSVFLAKDLIKEEANDSNPYVAIKFLNEDFKKHPQSLISLQREAKKSQTLAHPNIVNVYDFDRDGDTVYMTMEHMEGRPLDELLRANHGKGIKHEDAIKIIDDVSKALAYAHENLLVHSDFKPGNVFVTKNGTAKVLDFGIARAVKHQGDQSGDQTLFDAGDLGGLTPAYASCEMLEGKAPTPSDDIYALGCVAYEMLSGSHPFNKLPANKARDQKLTPPLLKQLDKKQSNALLHSLKFSNSERTENAQEFIADFFVHKQTSKGIKITLAIAATLLIGIGAKFFLDFQKEQQIETLVTSINQGGSNEIKSGIAQIQSLSQTNKEKVLIDVRDTIIEFYASLALPLADQNKGNYNFPKAIATISEAKQLYPDSARVIELIEQLNQRKDQLLNTLSDQIGNYLKKGNLKSKSNTDDLLGIFELIKTIDPNSGLLSDRRLPLAYAREIKQAIGKDQLSLAQDLVNNAEILFPKHKDLTELVSLLKDRQQQLIEDQKLAALQKKLAKEGASISTTERKKAIKRHSQLLNELLDDPFNDENWITQVKKQMLALKTFALKNDTSLPQLKAKIGKLLLTEAKKQRRQGDLSKARNLLNHTKDINPKSSALKRENRALAIAERKQAKQQKNQETLAKIEALKQSLLTQAKANDVKKARVSYNQLRKLAATDVFTQSDAPQAIGDAYLRLANGLAKQKQFKDALALTENGLKISTQHALLQSARDEYLAVVTVKEAKTYLNTASVIDSSKIDKLLTTIQRGLPEQFSTVEADIANVLITRIKVAAESSQTKAEQLIRVAQLVFPDNKQIKSLSKRSSKLHLASGQVCKSSYAGHGNRSRATCFDQLNDETTGPLLVVIPSTKNIDSFAISKYEISIANYNHYCSISNECKTIRAIEPKLPVTNISIGQINQYISWLSNQTGANYHLPTNTQWTVAATADSKSKIKDYNCRLMLGSKQIKGLSLVDVQSGKQNSWGVVNFIGNARELVSDNNKYYVRGGSYVDSFSQCSISLKKSHSGKAEKNTGFRVVKELH